MASRWSRRSVLTASRACHKSGLAMVIDALASALLASPHVCGLVASVLAVVERAADAAPLIHRF